ncbi:MAG: hypothetical protein ABSB22_11710 [Thermodesulfobacteriota bacterium]|jgi:hypothetical protein
MKCTNEEIGSRVADYASRKYIEDEQVEIHLLECEYCWEKAQQIEKQKKLKRVENLIQTHFTEEAFQDILEEIKKEQHQVLRELGGPSVAEPESSQLPLLHDGEPADELIAIDKKISAKRLAHDFIQKSYPSELKLFDLAWGIFKDITPKDLTQQAVSGALGIVGEEASQLKTPKVIILFNQIKNENIEALPDEKFKEAVTEIGRATGCSPELIDKAIEFILGA